MRRLAPEMSAYRCSILFFRTWLDTYFVKRRVQYTHLLLYCNVRKTSVVGFWIMKKKLWRWIVCENKFSNLLSLIKLIWEIICEFKALDCFSVPPAPSTQKSKPQLLTNNPLPTPSNSACYQSFGKQSFYMP
jgi:hypothetical protein